MSSTTQKEFAAAREFYGLIVEKLTSDKGVHAETAIASAARMAGTFLLRSFNLPIEKLEPGAPVLSDAADEKGPFLINLFGGVLSGMNVTLESSRLVAAQGEGDKPHLGVIETQALLESDMSRINAKYQLNYEEAAHAGAIAAAIMVRECAGVIDPHVGFDVAAYGFVEGSKTVPQKLKQGGGEGGKKPWYKLW